MPGAPDRRVAKTPDGASISYRLRVGGGGQRLLLLHPLAMDLDFWDGVAGQLGDLDILTVDLRGHGQSSPIRGSHTADDYAEDLTSVMSDIGWESAYVAGASMGGCVAIALAGLHPDRVLGLGLIDTTDWYGPQAPADWEARASKAMANGLESLLAFQLPRWFSDGFREAGSPVIDRAVATFLANDAQSYTAHCRMLGAFDGRSVLARLECPARIIVGAEDYATPTAMAEAMLGRLRHAELCILEQVRHFTPLEIPDAVAAQLRLLCTSSSATSD